MACLTSGVLRRPASRDLLRIALIQTQVPIEEGQNRLHGLFLGAEEGRLVPARYACQLTAGGLVGVADGGGRRRVPVVVGEYEQRAGDPFGEVGRPVEAKEAAQHATLFVSIPTVRLIV